MANAIYTTTRDELAGLVSRQVASGMLSRAVASVGSDPTTVDASTMSRLLRGRVRRELERTLPRAGVRRRLADLDARLTREHGASAAPAPTPSAPTAPAKGAPAPVDRPSDAAPTDGALAAPADPRPSPLGRAATVWTREPADTGTFDERRRAFPVSGDVVATRPAVEPATPTQSRAVTTPAAPTPATPTPATTLPASSMPAPADPPTAPHRAVRPAPHPPATDLATDRHRPDRLIERITDDDAVRQWIWRPAHGPPEGRGAGPDPAHVAGTLGSLTTVLGRHGTVRSLHVHHGQGHVMMGVDRGSTLVIAGDEDLNLGAVYASFRALEEEP